MHGGVPFPDFGGALEEMYAFWLAVEAVAVVVFWSFSAAYILHRSRLAFIWLAPAVLYAMCFYSWLGFDGLTPFVAGRHDWGRDLVHYLHLFAFMGLVFLAVSPLTKRLLGRHKTFAGPDVSQSDAAQEDSQPADGAE